MQNVQKISFRPLSTVLEVEGLWCPNPEGKMEGNINRHTDVRTTILMDIQTQILPCIPHDIAGQEYARIVRIVIAMILCYYTSYYCYYYY